MTIAVFADMAKAFDSLDRNILVHKLQTMGFTDSFLKILVNYLENRKQKVNLNGILSDAQPRKNMESLKAVY